MVLLATGRHGQPRLQDSYDDFYVLWLHDERLISLDDSSQTVAIISLVLQAPDVHHLSSCSLCTHS